MNPRITRWVCFTSALLIVLVQLGSLSCHLYEAFPAICPFLLDLLLELEPCWKKPLICLKTVTRNRSVLTQSNWAWLRKGWLCGDFKYDTLQKKMFSFMMGLSSLYHLGLCRCVYCWVYFMHCEVHVTEWWVGGGVWTQHTSYRGCQYTHLLHPKLSDEPSKAKAASFLVFHFSLTLSRV